jgi:osmotically-inducible protein OsmY
MKPRAGTVRRSSNVLQSQEGMVKTQESLKRDVEQELLWDQAVDARSIKVNCNGGTVTLNGTVPNRAQKWEAQRAAQRAAPEAVIHNGLSIRCPDTGRPSDSALAGEIRSTFAQYAGLRDAAIDVRVVDGRVTLTGMLDSPVQRDEAAMLIRDVPCIVDIDNRIVTRLGETERDVASSIATALQGAKLQPAENIVVNVRDGVVRLTGNCRSAKQKEVACEAAWNAKGVRWVVDQLHVG